MITLPYIEGNTLEETCRLQMPYYKVVYTNKTNRNSDIPDIPIYTKEIIGNKLDPIPESVIDLFLESYKSNMGPMTDIAELLTAKYPKICPECIKNGLVPIYQTLYCFERCLEHDIPLIDECPKCGSSLVLHRNQSKVFVIDCPNYSCNTAFNDFTMYDAAYFSLNNKGYRLKEKPSDDLHAAYFTTREYYDNDRYALNSKEMKEFCRLYLAEGKRRIPDDRISKSDINQYARVLCRGAKDAYAESMAEYYRRKSEVSDEFAEKLATLKILADMEGCEFFTLLPPGTYSDTNRFFPTRTALTDDRLMTKIVSAEYARRYYELLRPLVKSEPNTHIRNIIDVLPQMYLDIIIIETINAYDIYCFETVIRRYEDAVKERREIPNLVYNEYK